MTVILLLGVLKLQSQFLSSQSGESVNAGNVIVAKELLCGVIILTDMCGREKYIFLICLFSK